MAKRKNTSPSQSDEHNRVVQIVSEYRAESDRAKRDRMLKNRRNWNLYYGNVDFTHKIEGQSAEHLPKIGVAAENMSAFIRRALVQFGDFFSVEVPNGSPITSEQIRALMRRFLEKLAVGPNNEYEHFSAVMGDAVKQGLMESLIVLKVHGHVMPYRELAVEPGNLVAGIEEKVVFKDSKVWKLRIDTIPGNDYGVDPTGRKLYEIHRVERDLVEVWDMVEAGLYDKAQVEKLVEDVERTDEYRKREADRNQNETTTPSNRKRVVIDEVWGTLLGPDGLPLNGQRNIVTTIANERIVIREPEANPFWHQESPFVARAIIRSPDSVWSKAVYDDAASLNEAIDEMYNLILDGGIASVWGVRQVRTSWLEDPRQVADGISPGATLALSEDAPVDGKVVEQVSTGKVPVEAMGVLNLTDSEFNAAALTNDPRLGALPAKQVKATEVMVADQSSNLMIDTLSGDLEVGVIEPVLRKAWLNILQNANDISSQEVVDTIGVEAAFRLSRMSEAQRYAAFAAGCRFRVYGLSATLAKARTFQQFMALSQSLQTNPMLLESFMRRYSPDKTLDTIMKSLNVNPEELGITPAEEGNIDARLQNMQMLQGVAGAPGGSPARQPGEGSEMDAQRSTLSADVQGEGGFQ